MEHVSKPVSAAATCLDCSHEIGLSIVDGNVQNGLLAPFKEKIKARTTLDKKQRSFCKTLIGKAAPLDSKDQGRPACSIGDVKVRARRNQERGDVVVYWPRISARNHQRPPTPVRVEKVHIGPRFD